MAYGDSLGVTLPETLVTPGATAAGMINAAIQACVDRLETQVTVAGMDINADLPMQSGATSYGLIDVHRVSFFDQTSALNAVTYPQSMYAVGSDLYFNDDAGNQVRLVTAGALDLSSVGGITGAGYGTAGVEVNWDGTNYRFKDGSGAEDYSAIVVDDVLLRDGSGNAIRLAAPAGMSADYTATLPGAVPAANSVLVMTTTGVISHSTNPAALTLAADGSFTVTGTGRYIHGNRFLYVGWNDGYWYPDEWVPEVTANPGYVSMSAAGGGSAISFPVRLDTKKQITAIDVYVQGDATNRLTATFYSAVSTTGAVTSISTVDSAASASNQTLALFSGTQNITSGNSYFVQVALRAGSAADADLRVYCVAITYNEP